MTSLHRMLEEVKQSLRPDPSLIRHRDAVIDLINQELRKREVAAVAVAGGSVAKNTFLVDDHDVDVFVRFSLEYSMEEEVLPEILERVLKRFKPVRIHGSRDYFQFGYEDLEFEVIPVLAVEDAGEALNVTDMSPLHVQYFLSRSKGQEDEVRLLKQFCKAAGVYGAESYIRGFSGHVIDLLVLAYDDFYGVVKAASRWKPPVIIDLEEHHDDALSAIDTAKHAPLLVVDPVQPERNAAAALSREQFDAFISRCRDFIRAPSESFFVRQVFDEKDLRQRLSAHAGAAVLVFARHPENDKHDVAGARIRKAFERLLRGFRDSGFSLVEDGWEFVFGGESVFWYVVEEHSLPRLQEHQGPPVSHTDAARRFRETHDGVEERDGVLFTRIERAVRVPREVVESLSSSLSESLGVTVRVEDVQ